jgi:hypothetical protein
MIDIDSQAVEMIKDRKFRQNDGILSNSHQSRVDFGGWGDLEGVILPEATLCQKVR